MFSLVQFPLSRSQRAGVKVRTTLSLALCFCLAGGAGSRSAEAAEETRSLPELPQLAFDKMLPTVRAVVQAAYSDVLAHPRDAAANGKLGMVLHAHGLSSEAETCYQRAHLLDPSLFHWTYYLGLVQVDQRKCKEAIVMFREALRIDPGYLAAQLRMGECLLVSAEWQEAGKVYGEIVQRHPDSAEAYYGLGRIRAAHDDFPGAVESLRKACDLFPKFAAAHFALARAYRRLGKADQAEAELALSKRSEGGLPDISDPLLSEVEKLNRDYNLYLKLGVELAAGGKLQDAADAFEGALEINPQLPQAHTRLIYLYGQLGQVAKAEAHYRAAVRLDPKRSEAYFNYGTLLLDQGRLSESAEAFREALAANPRYAEAHNNLGFLLEGQGKVTDAIEEYRKALESSPDFPQANFALGRILVKEGNFEEGIPHLLKSLHTEDEDTKTSYLYALGIAYSDVGDLKNGLRYLHLARGKAADRKQAKLLASIEDDLRLLEGAGSPQ